MATRPVYISEHISPYVNECFIDFDFFPGFSVAQKQRSFLSLHENFLKEYHEYKVLEISSKSNIKLGALLSAFNLMITTTNRSFPVENAFQSSKVFERGGPYIDLLDKSPKEAKKDERLKNSGRLVAFKYFNNLYPLNPIDYFYNWLYINALNLNTELAKEIVKYDAFTDIEFNPQKSINCQARSVAIFVGLSKSNMLDEALKSQRDFLRIVYRKQIDDKDYEQLTFDL
ncbi:DarT1-associated NADAR antitoxin family protein [Lacrimispora sp. 38-1]|uniref:DarT1-associated NADAR antitoxin family protein n=1 Tax=Lacrimispora sp. 38-1 TaxID=3125778 RepID=UPI003CFAFF1B